ncbi:MAG TPA: hypothetical protein ENN09_06365 [Planctomycetes bacterium]|nr:hypothetical protein [Planctomycetota bacterium]
MGCGRVDIIELFDLVRQNLGGVRRRELEAHLQGCRLCAEDVNKLTVISSAMSSIAAATDVSPSPVLLKQVQAAMEQGVSGFQGAKARNLWAPNVKPASTRKTRPMSPLYRRVKAAFRTLAVLVLLLALLAGITAAAFRRGIGKNAVWWAVEELPAHPFTAKVFGIPGREECGRIILGLPGTRGQAAKLADAAKWRTIEGASEAESEFLKTAAVIASQTPPDEVSIACLKALWQHAIHPGGNAERAFSQSVLLLSVLRETGRKNALVVAGTELDADIRDIVLPIVVPEEAVKAPSGDIGREPDVDADYKTNPNMPVGEDEGTTGFQR